MPNKPHIVVLHPHFTLPGGAGKFILEVSQRLVKNDYRVTIVSMKSDPQLTSNAQDVAFVDVGGPLTSSFSFWLLYPYWLWKVARIITRLQPDVLFPQVFPAQWWAFIYKLFHPELRVVWMCQEPSAFIHSERWINAIHSPVKRFLARLLKVILQPLDCWLARQADAIIANSAYSKQQIIKAYSVRDIDVTIAYPGVPEEILQKCYNPQRKPLAVTVSRLSAFKNVDFLVRMFVEFAQKQPEPWKLIIIGDGEERRSLQQLITSLKAEKFITLAGVVSDKELIKTLSEATFYLSAAIDEPFGISIVEAQALGTIAIAHNSGGPRETVIQGQTGMLINRLDSKMYQSALLQCLSRQKIKNLSQLAHQHGSQYSWDHTTEQIKAALLPTKQNSISHFPG